MLRGQAVVGPDLQLRTVRHGAARVIQVQSAGRPVLQLELSVAEIHEQPTLVVVTDTAPERDQVAGRGTATGIVHAQPAVDVLNAEVTIAERMRAPLLDRQPGAIPEIRARVVGRALSVVVQTQM